MAVPGEAEPFDDATSATSAMLLVDPDGSIRRTNPPADALFRFSASSSTGSLDRNVHDLVCEPSEMELAEHLASACGIGRVGASDMLMKRTDGTSFWARMRSETREVPAPEIADRSIGVLLTIEAIDDPLANMERLFADEPEHVFEEPRARRTRVMVVDDEVAPLAETTGLLESLGHEVVGFNDPKLALEEFALRSHDYDAVIVDDQMPPIEGLALCRALLEIRYEVPVLLASSEGARVDVASAIAVGVDEVLAKPLVGDELAQWLRGAAGRSL